MVVRASPTGWCWTFSTTSGWRERDICCTQTTSTPVQHYSASSPRGDSAHAELPGRIEDIHPPHGPEEGRDCQQRG